MTFRLYDTISKQKPGIKQPWLAGGGGGWGDGAGDGVGGGAGGGGNCQGISGMDEIFAFQCM